MEWNQVEAKWKNLKGKARETWGKLTDDELEETKGKRDQLLAKIQERYGYAKEKAEREVDSFLNKIH